MKPELMSDALTDTAHLMNETANEMVGFAEDSGDSIWTKRAVSLLGFTEIVLEWREALENETEEQPVGDDLNIDGLPNNEKTSHD